MKLNLTDLTSLANATTAINTINLNSQLIEDAVENTLSRDGTSPNVMNANIDLNSFRLLNPGKIDMVSSILTGLPDPVNPTDAVPLAFIGNAPQYAAQALASANVATTEAGIATTMAAAVVASGLGVVITAPTGGNLTTGVKADLEIPFNCTIQRCDVLLDQPATITLDIWKSSYAAYPPTVANSIVGSSPPTVTADVKSSDSTLAGWTTAISAGDILRFSITNTTPVSRCTVSFKIVRT